MFQPFLCAYFNSGLFDYHVYKTISNSIVPFHLEKVGLNREEINFYGKKDLGED